MNDKIQPLHDRVIIEVAPMVSKTASGIIIPDTAKEKAQTGKVMYVGDGLKDEPLKVRVGDMVLYGKHAGQEIEIDGNKFLLMREADIYAII